MISQARSKKVFSPRTSISSAGQRHIPESVFDSLHGGHFDRHEGNRSRAIKIDLIPSTGQLYGSRFKLGVGKPI